ncbi:MAG: hypothetical protein UY99_C0007G0024 [Parcubacteria group bacterium GW2011_GWA1_59_11]|nr:MAG: hypothetical protein UY99_C0007G0024 [Parcubacteria group bacterium GW2011_GWA1_59_11]
MNRRLAGHINKLARADRRMRKAFSQTGVWDDKIDRANTSELKKIIRKHGWPTIPMVGKKASFNAWLLAQHADREPKFQERVLKFLIKVDEKYPGAINRAHIAFLTDRLLVAKRKPQEFGTQFYFDKSKKLRLNPLQSKRKINELRKRYDLPPLEFHLKEAAAYNAGLRK